MVCSSFFVMHESKLFLNVFISIRRTFIIGYHKNPTDMTHIIAQVNKGQLAYQPGCCLGQFQNNIYIFLLRALK